MFRICYFIRGLLSRSMIHSKSGRLLIATNTMLRKMNSDLVSIHDARHMGMLTFRKENDPRIEGRFRAAICRFALPAVVFD
jgi:hypothetical protein